MSDAVTPRGRAKTRRVGRRRRVLSWVALGFGLLVTAMIVLSMFKWYGLWGRQVNIEVFAGLLIIEPIEPNSPQTGPFISQPQREWSSPFHWTLDEEWEQRSHHERRYFGLLIYGYRASALEKSVTVLLWPLAALPLIAGVGLRLWAWRDVRRVRLGLCLTCRYDLRGLPEAAPCPECGKVQMAGVASGDEGKGGS